MVKKCICQICVCGRHRCPHRPFTAKGSGPCAFSEYHDEYKKKNGGKLPSFKPTHQPIKNSDPMSDKTTQRVDFIKHPGMRPVFRQPEQYIKPGGDIDTMTSYKKDYVPKDVAPPKAFRRDDARKVQGRFEGDPTYRSDYRKWALPEKKLYHDPNLYKAPDAPFEGEPTYKSDYHKHPFSMRQSLRPDEGL
ncbi:FAM154B [Bugula neritina]|uniref:FAM154B n=1 Tax=Bugula neritina TaxID=10212 RepID=A0A7J7KFN4_BUGNE|nr:FAM154B [Bugula neritina]